MERLLSYINEKISDDSDRRSLTFPALAISSEGKTDWIVYDYQDLNVNKLKNPLISITIFVIKNKIK